MYNLNRKTYLLARTVHKKLFQFLYLTSGQIKSQAQGGQQVEKRRDRMQDHQSKSQHSRSET